MPDFAHIAVTVMPPLLADPIQRSSDFEFGFRSVRQALALPPHRHYAAPYVLSAPNSRPRMACALGVAALLLAAGLVTASSAAAENGACQSSAQATQGQVAGEPGETNHLAVGFRGSDNHMRFIDTGTKSNGDPLALDFDCSAVGPWLTISLTLGDRNDSARLDAVNPTLAANGFGPVPASVDARLQGGTGKDVLRGHAGFDHLEGGRGPDKLIDGGGNDVLGGGGGADVIKAADGSPDIVNCGPRRDTAIVDRADSVRGCERVHVR